MEGEGISLHDFAKAESEGSAEGADEPLDVADPTPEPQGDETPGDGEGRREPLPEKPAGPGETPPDAESTERGDGPAPDAPEGDTKPETPTGTETPPEGPDELGELTKRGWPKPKFSDEDLKDNEQAREERRHWRNVFSRSRQEVAEFRKQFDGIEPAAAQQHKAVYDDLMTNEKFADARVYLGIQDHAESQQYVEIARALVNPSDPNHMQAVQIFQQARTGHPAPAPAAVPSSQQSILQQAVDEFGDIDQGKFDTLMAQRDRQIAERAFQMGRRPAQPSNAPNQPPQANEGPDVVEQFADFQGLDASEIRPLLTRELHRSRADGVEPEDSIRGVKMLWDRVLASRETDVQAERQAEVARLKGASISRPRSAVPDGGDPATGLSLFNFAKSEAESTQ